MSTHTNTWLLFFYSGLKHGWHPKIPHNHVEIPRLTPEQLTVQSVKSAETASATTVRQTLRDTPTT